VSSRFIPGARLPTYLAAGFLRVPFGRFLWITGSAVAVWTSLIFGLAVFIGPSLLGWLRRWSSGGWALLAAIVLVFGAVRLGQSVIRGIHLQEWSITLERWSRWEFWPAWLFYPPVVVQYIRLAIRHRSVTLPTISNPGIYAGGFVGESKISTLKDLGETSPEFTAQAWLLRETTADARRHELTALIAEHSIEFPFILKPDIGRRGVGVKLIRRWEDAERCLAANPSPLLVQRYAPGPNEVGIFYYRFPGEARGRIWAITEKIFPIIEGDGSSTLEDLVRGDPRARLIAEKYLSRFADRLREVPAAGEAIRLVEAGNHAQGCIFRDGWHFWTPELESQIDAISRRLNGFHIGRYDIRYNTAEDLRSGSRFQIVELNGASSEPTNIYDASTPLLKAYRALFEQWDLVFRIAAANRALGIPAMKPSELWRAWRMNDALVATYPGAD
jgi:hypothetical protein